MKKLFARIGLWLNALRWNQWTKGLWVLFALFGREQNTLADLYKIALVLLVAILLSGGIYINNDIHDIEKDRMHPTKKFRPFASGELAKEEGKKAIYVLAVLLLILFLIIGNWTVVTLAIAMAMGNYAYTKWIKNIPYVELLFYGPLASFRYWMGAAAVGNPFFVLQSLFVMFSSISGLSLLRLMEKERYGNGGRKHLTKYSGFWLRIFIVGSGVVTIIANLLLTTRIAEWMLLPSFGATLFLLRMMVLGMQKVDNPEKVDDIDKMVKEDLWLKILGLPYFVSLVWIFVLSLS